MSSLLQPLHLLLMMFAGWVNRHQLDVIDYLQEENRVLKERLGGRRVRFTDAERRRLARKAYALGLCSAKTGFADLSAYRNQNW
jgi:putative transposase